MQPLTMNGNTYDLQSLRYTLSCCEIPHKVDFLLGAISDQISDNLDVYLEYDVDFLPGILWSCAHRMASLSLRSEHRYYALKACRMFDNILKIVVSRDWRDDLISTMPFYDCMQRAYRLPAGFDFCEFELSDQLVSLMNHFHEREPENRSLADFGWGIIDHLGGPYYKCSL